MMGKNELLFRFLSPEECTPGLLGSFERFQRVTHCWRREGEHWVLKEAPFIDDWDAGEKREVISLFRSLTGRGGKVYGAFHQGVLIAFGALDAILFGSRRQYLQLVLLHVSRTLRNRGIGTEIFFQLARTAHGLGAQKLYISTQSSRETQAFYKSLGCVHAQEVNPELAQAEPWDIQLEYDLEKTPGCEVTKVKQKPFFPRRQERRGELP